VPLFASSNGGVPCRKEWAYEGSGCMTLRDTFTNNTLHYILFSSLFLALDHIKIENEDQRGWYCELPSILRCYCLYQHQGNKYLCSQIQSSSSTPRIHSSHTQQRIVMQNNSITAKYQPTESISQMVLRSIKKH